MSTNYLVCYYVDSWLCSSCDKFCPHLFTLSVIYIYLLLIFDFLFVNCRPEFCLLIEPPTGNAEYLIAEIQLPGVVSNKSLVWITFSHMCKKCLFYFFILLVFTDVCSLSCSGLGRGQAITECPTFPFPLGYFLSPAYRPRKQCCRV